MDSETQEPRTVTPVVFFKTGVVPETVDKDYRPQSVINPKEPEQVDTVTEPVTEPEEVLPEESSEEEKVLVDTADTSLLQNPLLQNPLIPRTPESSPTDPT